MPIQVPNDPSIGTQIQLPNYMGDPLLAENRALKQAQIQDAQQQIAQRTRQNQIAVQSQDLAARYAQGDGNAGQQLAAVNPELHKSVTDNITAQTQRAGVYATAINSAPLDQRPQVYKKSLEMAANDPLVDQKVLSQFPAEYNRGLDPILFSIQQTSRNLEDAMKAKQEAATLAQSGAQLVNTRADTQLKGAQTTENLSKSNLQNAQTAETNIATNYKYNNNYGGPMGSAMAKADTQKLDDLSKQAKNYQDTQDQTNRFAELAGKINPASPIFGGGIIGKTIGSLENINQYPEYKEFSQMATKIAGQAAKANVGSRVSNYEAKLYQDNAANAASGTKESNINFANQYKAMSDRAIQQNLFYQQYANTHGDLRGADQQWTNFANENPILSRNKAGLTSINQNNVGNWQSYVQPGYSKSNQPAANNQSSQNNTPLPEGRTAVNPKTGERIVFKEGKWMPL